MSKQARAEGDDFVYLVDLEADPGETTNLRAKYPKKADELLSLHDAWRETVFESQ